MLEPIKDSIIFAFEDDVIKTNFVEKTESGIYLGIDNNRAANVPRWGKVIAVGPDVSDVKRGDRIYVDAMRWTIGMKYDNVQLWRTVEPDVLCVAN